jgi:hypothetical protein
VAGLEYWTHPDLVQLLEDLVVRDGAAGHSITSALRTPPWLPSGWGCRGRRLSRA